MGSGCFFCARKARACYSGCSRMLFAVPLLPLFKAIVTGLLFLLCSACRPAVVDRAEIEQFNAVETRTSIPETVSSFSTLPEPLHRLDIQPKADQSLRLKPSGVDTVDAVSDSKLYSVAVQQVPVSEVLRTIAHNSAFKVDFIGDIEGDISLTMTDQTLESILAKISSLLPVRYEVNNGGVVITQYKPYVRNYEVDYLNMQRLSESRVDLATQVGSIRTAVDGDTQGQAGSNGSQLFVENKSVNVFWDSVVNNITALLGETVGGNASDSGNSGDNLFVNRESGIISVRARESQHRSIAELLSEVLAGAQRQVLIEATVVEVALSDQFESGVDWRLLTGSSNSSIDYAQIFTGSPQAADVVAPANALLTLNNISSLGNLSATLKLLQQFGEVQVLSSPRIIAMNNQPAVLKVVDNRIYFTFEVDRLQRENGDESTVVDSTVHSVPVGLVMNVTPFINKSDEVILNVRPTISRILNFAEDPSPALAGQNEVRNLIPEIQVREMESLLRVPSGEVAVIGGLMQNKTDLRSTGVPRLNRIPWFGKIFSHDTRTVEKTELLIFLKPTVVTTEGLRQ